MFWGNNILWQYNHDSFRRNKILDVVIIAFLVLVLAPFVTTSYATSTQNRLIDNAEILSEQQVDNINGELFALQTVPLIIVVNEVGNRCTDDYAYSYAKSLYQDIFSTNQSEGMVIAYCSSLEGYKIGIYYQGDSNIDTRQLKKQITSAYSLYSTDASWIEGSCVQSIQTINEITQSAIAAVPSPVIDTQETNIAHRASFWEKFGKYQLAASVLATVFVAGILVAIIGYRKHRKQIDNDIDYWINNKKED